MSDDNEQYSRDSHAHMLYLSIFFRIINISFWYVNSLERYRLLYQAILMCFGYILNDCFIIMDRAINAPVHGNNIVDGINTTDKYYLKG